MSYFKGTGNGYIGAIGYGEITSHGVKNASINTIGAWSEIVEISDAEYAELQSVFKAKPHAEGKGYRLKENLTWEEYDIPVPSEDDEISNDEAFAILTGESV